MKEVGVMMTMDCEPTKATSHPTATGPRDWEHGETAVRGYWEAGKARGFPVTYFVHPETTIGQPALFNNWKRRGHAWDCICIPGNTQSGAIIPSVILPITGL